MPEPLSLMVLLLTTVSDRGELCTPPPFPLIVLLVIEIGRGQEPPQFCRPVSLKIAPPGVPVIELLVISTLVVPFPQNVQDHPSLLIASPGPLFDSVL